VSPAYREETGPGWRARLGRWQDVLASVADCAAIITDGPYSARTHDGQSEARGALAYAALSEDDVRAFVASWAPRCRGWFVAMTDDVLAPVWRRSFADAGRYDFAPLPILQHRPRLQGDGPSSSTVWMLVSRPRSSEWMGWGSLPGWYEAPPEKNAGVLGAKPLGLMRAIVRDYTRPDDLVVDPFCGSGTTALACAMEGRRCVTAEVDERTYDLAVKRLRRGHTPDLFAGGTP